MSKQQRKVSKLKGGQDIKSWLGHVEVSATKDLNKESRLLVHVVMVDVDVVLFIIASSHRSLDVHIVCIARHV